MNNYPNINGLHFDMSLDEVKDIVKGSNYGEIKLTSKDRYCFESKDNEFVGMFSFIMSDNHLIQFEIINWKDYFGFDDNNIKFRNIVEILHNYFLRIYECYSCDQNLSCIVEIYDGFDVIIDYIFEKIIFKKSKRIII